MDVIEAVKMRKSVRDFKANPVPKKILKEIQTGQFAKEWILENKAGAAAFKSRA